MSDLPTPHGPTPEGPSPATPRRGVRLADRTLLLLVGLLASLPFAQALGFPRLGYDDDIYLERLAYLWQPLGQALWSALTQPQYAAWTPVTSVSFLIDARLERAIGWGWGPSHALNVALFAGTAVMVAALGRSVGLSRAAFTLGAAVFALHPIHAEPVCWLTARKDLLATGFSVAFLLVGLSATKSPARRPLLFAAAFTLGLFALLAKPTAVYLPLLALAWPALSGARRGRTALVFGPLAVAAVGVFVVNLLVKQAAADLFRPEGLSLWDRVFLPIHVLGAHTQHLLAPLDLSPVYPPAQTRLSDPHFLTGILALSALVVLKLRHGRAAGPGWWLLVCAIISLGPVLNLVPNLNTRQVTDSFSYPASVFFCLGIGQLLARPGARPRRLRWIEIGLVGGLVLSLGGLAIRQARAWRSDGALWLHATETQPEAPHAWVSLANVVAYSGQLDGALALLAEAHRRFPAEPIVTNNLAVVTQARGDWATAAALLSPLSPEDGPSIRYNLAILALRGGHLEEGRALLEPLERDPSWADDAQQAVAAAAALLDQGAQPPLGSAALFLRAFHSTAR